MRDTPVDASRIQSRFSFSPARDAPSFPSVRVASSLTRSASPLVLKAASTRALVIWMHVFPRVPHRAMLRQDVRRRKGAASRDSKSTYSISINIVERHKVHGKRPYVTHPSTYVFHGSTLRSPARARVASIYKNSERDSFQVTRIFLAAVALRGVISRPPTYISSAFLGAERLYAYTRARSRERRFPSVADPQFPRANSSVTFCRSHVRLARGGGVLAKITGSRVETANKTYCLRL